MFFVGILFWDRWEWLKGKFIEYSLSLCVNFYVCVIKLISYDVILEVDINGSFGDCQGRESCVEAEG